MAHENDHAAGVLDEVAKALQNLKYGSIELTFHDGRLVQLERREKRRYEPQGPVSRPRATETTGLTGDGS